MNAEDSILDFLLSSCFFVKWVLFPLYKLVIHDFDDGPEILVVKRVSSEGILDLTVTGALYAGFDGFYNTHQV